MKKLRVTVEGKVYDVLVEMIEEAAPPRPAVSATAAPVASAHLPVPVATPAAAPRSPVGSGDITSPLAGKLVSIDVKLGQVVEEGVQVATVEAMKMNTYIFAPKPGAITEICAAPGDGIEEGAVLIRMS